ncbi:hypothetical protein MBLNU457_6588t1 [Dothideomycetes sp. NU457]
MDIDRLNFPPRLLDILEAISESSFVSVDLELSGVPVRKSGGTGSDRHTLAQRYQEIREAAQQFQILQIGLTCVKENHENGSYELKPFNINLSPVVEERLEIERVFAFHSGAVEFLNSVGFNFQTPFQWGVPYLSRDESQLARKKFLERLDRSKDAIADMVIKPEDKEALELMRKVREEVKRWKGKTNAGPLTLGSRLLSQGRSDELSRFEKRLIHQLIRSEFPDLVTISKKSVIQVIPFDKEREDKIRRERKKEAEERIVKLTGFRWVVEALCGSDIGKVDPKSFAFDPRTGEPVVVDLAELQARFFRAHFNIRSKPRVLVGHNCFLDFIYLYQAFIAPLPPTMEEFKVVLHDTFPTIIDTKYMATRDAGDINPASSLQQTAEQLQYQQIPVITTHKDHGKYEQATAFHEAGYDSLLTAQIAIRIAAKLEASGKYQKFDDPAPQDSDSSGEVEGGVQLGSGSASSGVASTLSGVKNLLLGQLQAIADTAPTNTKTDTGSQPSTSRYASKTAFDALQVEDGEEILQFDELPSMTDTDGPIPQEEVSVNLKSSSEERSESVPSRVMPRWSSDFWKVYGNHMRVFGTQEGVCQLGV